MVEEQLEDVKYRNRILRLEQLRSEKERQRRQGDLAAARDDAGGTRTALRGHLRVTLSPWILSRYILPALAPFKRAHPELSLEFLAVDRFVFMETEGVRTLVRANPLCMTALPDAVTRIMAQGDPT